MRLLFFNIEILNSCLNNNNKQKQLSNKLIYMQLLCISGVNVLKKHQVTIILKKLNTIIQLKNDPYFGALRFMQIESAQESGQIHKAH